MSAALLPVILLPAIGAVAARIAPPAMSRWVAVVAALVVLALACGAIGSGPVGGETPIGGTLPWLEAVTARPLFGILFDAPAAVMLLVVTFVGFLTVLFSAAYMREKNRDHPVGAEDQGRYYFRLLFFLASMTGVALSPNYLQLFFFWELTTVASWSLISFYQDERSLKAGVKALVMTHAGGLFFLAALLVMFAKTHSFAFDAPSALTPALRGWIFLFLAIAAWAKAAQFPFQTWLPDAMAAPTPVSAYLHAAAMVKAGVFLMVRTAAAGWEIPREVGLFLGVMALATTFLALSWYFVQDDLKRLLAWSTIAHLGYIMLGVALSTLGSTTALRAALLHIACHSVSKALLFLCAGAVAYITGSRSISALGGLGRSMPFTGTAFFVGLLSVTGVPPFACFWSKLMLLAGATELPGVIGPVVVGLVLVESLISFGWMLHVGQKIFLGTVTQVCAVNSDPPWPMSGALALLVLACLAMPAIAMPLVNLVGR